MILIREGNLQAFLMLYFTVKFVLVQAETTVKKRNPRLIFVVCFAIHRVFACTVYHLFHYNLGFFDLNKFPIHGIGKDNKLNI